MSRGLSSDFYPLRRMQMEFSLEHLQERVASTDAALENQTRLYEGLCYVLEMAEWLDDVTYLIDEDMFAAMWLASQIPPSSKPSGHDIPNADVIAGLAYIGSEILSLKEQKSKLMHGISILEGLL